MATSTVTDWDEIEADPDFSSLPQESRVKLFDDWENKFNRSLLEGADLDKVKPEGLNSFAAVNAVRRRKLAGEDVSDPDAAAKTWAEQKQAEAKLGQQALKDYADVEDKAFRLDDARSMPGVNEFGQSSPEWDKNVENASKNLEAAEAKFTPEVKAQAQAANEALRGERKVATLYGSIYTDPALVLNKDEFRQQVLDSDASPEAKALKLASYQSEKKRYLDEAVNTLTKGDPQIPLAESFPKFLESKGFNLDQEMMQQSEGKLDYSPIQKQRELAQEYLTKMQDRGWSRKIGSAIATGVATGMLDIGTQAVGTAAMLTGDEEKSKVAAELSRASGDIGAAQGLEGDMQATGGTFAGGVARLGTGMAPMFLPGGAVGGIARLAGAGAGAATAAAVGASALTAGAQTAGSQFGEVYDHLRRQGRTHEQAFDVSRNAAVLSGAVTTGLTALGGATGVESLLRQGGKELVKSRLLSAIKAVPGGAAAEIAEELPDEYISQLVSAFAKDPNASPSQVTDEFAANAPDLMLQIAALGGAGAGVGRFRGTTTDPTKAAQEAEFPTAGAPPPLRPQDYENRAAGGQPMFNEDGDVIGVAPPGATPEETAAYREEIRAAAEAATKGATPEVVDPIEGVDPAITDEMNERVTAGAGLAPQTVEALKAAQAASAPAAETLGATPPPAPAMEVPEGAARNAETLGVTPPPAPEVDTSETPPRAVNAPLDPADKQIDAPIAAKNGYVVFERPDGKRYKLRDNSKTPPEWQNAEGKKVMLKGFGTGIGNSFLLQPESKNSDYNEKAPVGDTVYHLYEEDSGRSLGNLSATQLFQTGWTFVEEVKPAEAPPITPQGTPTPATEGKVMPGGSAEAIANQPKKGDLVTVALGGREYPKTRILNVTNTPEGVRYQVDVFGPKFVAESSIIAVEKPIIKTAPKVAATPQLIRQLGDIAVKNKQPLDQGYIDSVGGNIPEGYTRQGDLYVFSPQNTTVAEPTETESEDQRIERLYQRQEELVRDLKHEKALEEIRDQNLSEGLTEKDDEAQTELMEEFEDLDSTIRERRESIDTKAREFAKNAIELYELTRGPISNAASAGAVSGFGYTNKYLEDAYNRSLASETAAPEWAPAVNTPAAFTAKNGQKLVGTVQSIKDGKAVVRFLWNGKEVVETVPVSQLARPVASLTEPPKYQYTQEQNTRKMGKHFPTAPGVYTNYDFRKSFASMAKDTSLSRIYRMIAKVMSKMPAFANMDLHVVADEDVRYAGEYSFSNGRGAIAVNLRQVGRGKVDALGTILHEALHHLTLAKVRNPKDAWENEIIDKLDAIRRRVLEYAESQGLGERLGYELNTVEEFISAVFTRPDFQNLLASIPDSFAPAVAVGKFRSMLSEVFRRLAELVTGEMVAKGSTMEQAMTSVLALFETPHRVVETGKLKALNAGRTRSAPGTPKSMADDGEPFYSKLSQVIEQKMPNRADVATIKGIINNPQTGIKAEEVKWSGIMPWLESQTGPITKQAVLDYLANDGAVVLEEVRMDDSNAVSADEARQYFGIAQREWDAMTPESRADMIKDASERKKRIHTRYQQYQLPGGENYREVVLAMPFAETPVFRKVFQLWRNDSVIAQGDETAANRWRSQGETDIRESQALNQETRAKAEYTSSHFPDVPNYVAHARLNDRTDSEGQPGTFIEEIQSDRHQAGREKGYKGQNPQAVKAKEEAEVNLRRLQGEIMERAQELRSENGFPERLQDLLAQGREAKARYDAIKKADERYSRLEAEVAQARQEEARRSLDVSGEIPDAPFRTTWPLQMFKRALADAVAQGKQWIGWTTGETQAERYDLSKQISSLEVRRDGDRYILNAYDINGNDAIQDRGVPRNELADVVGKDLANKIIGDFETNDAKREELRLSMEESRRGMNIGTEAEQEAAYDRYKALQKERQALPAPEEATYEGQDLKVGGEGMKGFYDNILPKEIGKYVKQWGAGVVKGSMGSKSPWNLVTDTNSDGQIVLFDTTTNRYVADWDKGTTTARSEDAAIFSRPAASSIIAATQSSKPNPIWRVDITPQMRAGVQSGQTLFSPADDADQRESDVVFGVMMEDGRFEEGVKMYDKAKRARPGAPPQPSANNSTPPRFANSAQFAAAFEAAYLRGDFDYFLEALKEADRHIYVPEMKKYINASKLGYADAAERLEWFRHAIAGTVPPNVKPQAKTPPQPQPSAGAPPPPVGMPPPPPAATPPPKAGVSNRPMLTLNTAAMGLIAKKLGASIRINTLLRRARGRIKLSMADGSEIELSKHLFKDPVQAAKTLAHEIGHLFDFLPASGFTRTLAHKLAPLGDFRKVFGNDLADWFMDGGKKIKPSKITQLIKSELVTLSKKWRGDFSPSDKYRGSGKELYADFISAILNDPLWTAKNAPYATLGFLNALEQKPEVDEAYKLVVSLVQGGSLYKALAEADRGKSTTALERLIAKSDALTKSKKIFKDAVRGLYRSMFGSWLPTAVRDGGIWNSYWKRLNNLGTPKDYNWAQEEASQYTVRRIAEFDNDIAKNVGIPLKTAGIDPHYLQRLQTNNRIIHERRQVGKLIEEDPVKARQLLKWMVDAGLLGKDVQDEVDATADEDLYKKTAEVIYKLHASGDGFERALNAARRKDAPADAEKALYAFDVSGFMLNPNVFTMESAEADNADIEKTLGPDQFGELQRINDAYHGLIKRIMVDAYKLGLFRKSTWDDVIVPNFGVYVPFMPIKYFTGYVKGGIGPSRVGTANDLMAPHVVGISKMHALISRMQQQKQALLLIDLFNNTGLSDEIEPVEDEKFDRQKAAELTKQSKNTISYVPYWDEGEYKWVKVNGTDAVSFIRNSDPDDLAAVYQLLKANTRLWRMNFTIFSIAFNVVNTLRNVVTPSVDIGPKAGYKAAKQLLSVFPQMGKWVWAKMAGRDMTSLVAASISVEHAMHKPGMPVSAELQEFYDRGILQPSPDVASLRMTQEELARSVVGALSSPELLLRGGNKAAKDMNWFDKTLKQYFYSAVDVLSFIGSVSEAAPKVAAYKALKEKKNSKGTPAFTDAQATYLATLEGIPRPGVGGSDNALWEMVLLFFRIMGQSWRKHLIMATAPQTRAGFLMRHMLFQGAKFGLQAMAANGAIDYLIALVAAAVAGGDDDDLEKYKQVDWAEAVSRQSDYKLSHGGVGPLICWVLPDGSIEPPYGHKSIPADWVPIMPRLPGTEFSRELDPMSYYATSKTVAPTIAPVNDDVFWNDYMRGLVSLNPSFDVVSDAMSVLGPTPPRDSYRGREKVEQRIWDEGYVARMLGLGEHHLRSFGIGSNPYDVPLPGALNVLKKPGFKSLISTDNMVGVREERRARREDELTSSFAQNMVGEKFGTLKNTFNRLKGKATPMTDQEEEIYNILKPVMTKQFYGTQKNDGMYDVLQSYARMKAQGLQDTPGGKLLKAEADQVVKDLEQTAEELQKPLEYLRTHTLP